MRASFLCLFSLLLSTAVIAQQKAAKSHSAGTLPTVKQILDNYEHAIGGRRAWSGVTSRVIKGAVELQLPEGQTKGTFESYEAQQPGRICSLMKFGNGAEAAGGFDGEVGWARNSQTGLRRLTGEELVDVKRGAQMPEEINFQTFFTQFDLKGRVKVNGREAYAIVGSSPDGSPWTMYFDAKTWLRTRLDWTHKIAQGSESMQVYYDDYRELENFKIKCPSRIKETSLGYTIVQWVDSIQINVPIDPAVLKAPSFRATIRR